MIFFDIDNTLIDHNLSERKAILALGTALGITEQPDDLAQRWQVISKQFYAQYLNKELSFEEQRTARVKEFFNGVAFRTTELSKKYNFTRLSDDDAKEIFSLYLEKYEEHWSLYEDVLPGLEKVRHLRLGIITNGETEQQLKKLSSVGLSEFFEIVITSHDAGYSKPDLRLFQYAADKAKIAIHKCLYIGDDFDSDSKAALNAGMKACWICRDGTPAEDYFGITVIDSLQKVQEL